MSTSVKNLTTLKHSHVSDKTRWKSLPHNRLHVCGDKWTGETTWFKNRWWTFALISRYNDLKNSPIFLGKLESGNKTALNQGDQWHFTFTKKTLKKKFHYPHEIIIMYVQKVFYMWSCYTKRLQWQVWQSSCPSNSAKMCIRSNKRPSATRSSINIQNIQYQDLNETFFKKFSSL